MGLLQVSHLLLSSYLSQLLQYEFTNVIDIFPVWGLFGSSPGFGLMASSISDFNPPSLFIGNMLSTALSYTHLTLPTKP